MNLTLKEIAQKFDCNVEDIKIIEEETKQLSEACKGDVVTIANREWIVFDHLQNGTTQLVSKNFVAENFIFDEENNDYRNSNIRSFLNKNFYNELSTIIGKENVVTHTVDLTSVDGRKDFGICEDFISMPSFDFIRENIELFDKFKDCINDWQWTVTPWSNEKTGWKKTVCCLLPGGSMHYFNCDNRNGVRAFCTLKSSISVSY